MNKNCDKKDNVICTKFAYPYESIIDYKFDNGDSYVGEHSAGIINGYGLYKFASGYTYTGYFSHGARHGIGTIENEQTISKGTWFKNTKHGCFHETHKLQQISTKKIWKNGNLITTKPVTYIPPNKLYTTKHKSTKKAKKQFIGNNEPCIICLTNGKNAAVVNCGHVFACISCLEKCGDKCSICNGKIDRIIKLYVS